MNACLKSEMQSGFIGFHPASRTLTQSPKRRVNRVASDAKTMMSGFAMKKYLFKESDLLCFDLSVSESFITAQEDRSLLLAVAHRIADNIKPMDADFSAMVDREFWNLF